MRIFVIATLTFALWAAACTAGAPENAAPTPTAQTNAAVPTGTPTPTASPAPPADEIAADKSDFTGTAGITDKRNPDIKAVGVMNAVRTARHGNYDRVVFEFEGGELPGYHIEYIDKPVRACGSGDTVPLAGDGWLEVRFTDAQAHTPEGRPTIAERDRSPDHPIIKQLRITCDFEGEVTWVLGVASPNKYRVLELKNPTRLVVDIKH